MIDIDNNAELARLQAENALLKEGINSLEEWVDVLEGLAHFLLSLLNVYRRLVFIGAASLRVERLRNPNRSREEGERRQHGMLREMETGKTRPEAIAIIAEREGKTQNAIRESVRNAQSQYFEIDESLQLWAGQGRGLPLRMDTFKGATAGDFNKFIADLPDGYSDRLNDIRKVGLKAKSKA